MKKRIELFAKKFLEKSHNKEIYIISHFDTDGITSAAIIIKTLKKLDKKFSVKIIKNLEEQIIRDLPKDKLILFLDLASGSLENIKKSNIKEIFIIDHHEISEPEKIPENVTILNPELLNKEKISAAGLCYLFSKEINPSNKENSKFAVLGMIGDRLEKNLDKLNNEILNDSEVIKKRGLLLFPATRPINRVLEFNSNPYIPGVTGDIKGVLSLLREIKLKPLNGKYKNILELDEREMSNLTTAIMLRKPRAQNIEIIGDIFLIKIFNKLEDARELSAMINACSRLGHPEIALQTCLEIPTAKKTAESLHVKYKRFLISGLEFVNKTEKTQGENYVIINAKNKIQDTIIGTIASILSMSSIYEPGTTIITMANYHNDKKIKVSARCVGDSGKNLRELLHNVVSKIGGEVGGHKFAAGCLIEKEKEKDFINSLRKNLEVEIVRV